MLNDIVNDICLEVCHFKVKNHIKRLNSNNSNKEQENLLKSKVLSRYLKNKGLTTILRRFLANN